MKAIGDHLPRWAGGLRKRAVTFGLTALADTEILELFLGRSLKTGAHSWAQVLLGKWRSIDAVLGADVADLEAVVGRVAAVDLKLLHDATLRVLAGSIRRLDVIFQFKRPGCLSAGRSG